MGRAARRRKVGRSRQNWAQNLVAESEAHSFPVCAEAPVSSASPPQVILSGPTLFPVYQPKLPLCSLCLPAGWPTWIPPSLPASHPLHSPLCFQAAAEPGVEAGLCELHRGHRVLRGGAGQCHSVEAPA